MTRTILLFPLSAALMLTACGDREGSPVEGEYRQVVKISEFDMPGIEGEEKQRTLKDIEATLGGDEGQKICLASGDQWKEAATRMSTLLGGNCITHKDEGSSTDMTLEMQCKATANGDVDIVMQGQSYTEGYAVKMSFDMKDPASAATAKLVMDIDADRVGDC